MELLQMLLAKGADPMATDDKCRTPGQLAESAGHSELKVILVPKLVTMTNQKDGSEMILITAGEFIMGSAVGEGDKDEHPQHRVYLDAYYIGKYYVTNGQFGKFAGETGYKTDMEKQGCPYVYEGGKWISKEGASWRFFSSSSTQKHPVTCVSWNDPKAYCKWAGGSLPTEAQWEKAARGTDGRIYPWGNGWDASRCRNNAGSASGGTTAVGSYSGGASPYGVQDMAGNVWECCADWYDENYYGSSPSRNPGGAGSGQDRVVRGGSRLNVYSGSFRCANRNWITPDYGYYNYGFRLCRSSNTP